MLYIARHLGPEDYGIFSFAFAFIYFFSFIPDMGVHQILVREAAKEPGKAGKLIGNGTIIKFFLPPLARIFLWLDKKYEYKSNRITTGFYCEAIKK